MTDVTAVSAAQRQRLVLDAQRVRDRQRTDVVQVRQDAFADAQRRAQIISQQVELAEQRLRDRRNEIDSETEAARALGEQQRVLDTVSNDTLFQRNQDEIFGELTVARDGREVIEDRLVRDLEAAHNDALERDAQERDALAQRAEDVRQALSDREARLAERRVAERNEDIRRQLDLSVSLDRIERARERPERPQDATPGGILDVRA